MSDTIQLNTVTEVHHALGLPSPKHPLVTFVNHDEIKSAEKVQDTKVVINLYQIVFKQIGCGSIQYGRNTYDYDEGTLIFIGPNQVMQYSNAQETTDQATESWVLAFHPDLIRTSSLGEKIEQYSFFSYDVREALHLSDSEKQTILHLISKIEEEYSQNLDRHSQKLITSNIELLLDYCMRFYDRQFLTRTNLNSDIVSKFDRILKGYYSDNKNDEFGLPSVKYCAKELALSSNYLSDLLKKETGKTAQEHIHLFIIDKAKNRLLNSTQSISSIGYELGFEHPQHFSTLFKAKTGMSPRNYRTMN